MKKKRRSYIKNKSKSKDATNFAEIQEEMIRYRIC